MATLSITETDEGRKVTGYLAGDNSWLLPGEEIIRIEFVHASGLPLPSYADMPYYGSTTYVAWTSYNPMVGSGPHTLVMNKYVKLTPEVTNYLIPEYLRPGFKSPVDSSLTSKSKTGGKSISYKPKSGRNCANGYRKINGMCVKQ